MHNQNINYDVQMQHNEDKNLQLTKTLGEVIQKLRIEKTGLSVNKLANEYGIDRGNLSRIENGLIDSQFTTIWKVSEALGMKFSDFIKVLESELDSDFTLIDE